MYCRGKQIFFHFPKSNFPYFVTAKPMLVGTTPRTRVLDVSILVNLKVIHQEWILYHQYHQEWIIYQVMVAQVQIHFPKRLIKKRHQLSLGLMYDECFPERLLVPDWLVRLMQRRVTGVFGDMSGRVEVSNSSFNWSPSESFNER